MHSPGSNLGRFWRRYRESHPSSTVSSHTPASPFLHPQSLPFCNIQLTSSIQNLIISPIICTGHSHGSKTIILWRLCGMEPGLQRWQLGEISTMLPALIKKPIKQFIYCHNHSPGLQPHLSTRWTGQTRLTNSQGAIHESWMARCSPRAPAFSRKQYACKKSVFTLITYWIIV